MRYSIPDPFDHEDGTDTPMPAPMPPPADASSPAEPPAMIGMAPAGPPEIPVPVPVPVPVESAAPPPADDALPTAAPIEPPVWKSADDQILHLPPKAVDQVMQKPWFRRWPWRAWQQGRWTGQSPRWPGQWSGQWPGRWNNQWQGRWSSGQWPGRWAGQQPGGWRGPWPRPRVGPWGPLPQTAAPVTVRDHRRGAIGAIGQLVRAAKRAGTWRNRQTGTTLPVFRARVAGRPFRIVTQPRGLRQEILSVEPELQEYENQLAPTAKPAGIQARILWPALGFPAVVTPSATPSPNTLRDGDATRCICLLILCSKDNLTVQDVARSLRCVPWTQRGRRSIEANSFTPAEIVVRKDVGNLFTIPGRKDGFGEHVRFGANANKQHGIVACLADRVRKLYRDAGLPHLYEIRITEAATARLQGEQYHLFWNNAQPGESNPSDEMSLLVQRYAIPERAALGQAWQNQRDFLTREYMQEYGDIHPPYNAGKGTQKPTPAEILHPLFIRKNRDSVRIGHVTDTHVDVRADVYDHHLMVKSKNAPDPATRQMILKAGYNNFNRSFEKVYRDARANSDVLLLTGDLIDYGRGHWGIGRLNELQSDGLYHGDRNWFLFYYLLASKDNYDRPSYTILGNHDWRLNPYPPFAPGAPKPNEVLHGHLDLKSDKQEQVIRLAHGDGHKRGFSYTTDAENAWQLLRKETLSALKALVQLFAQTSNLEGKGYPTETNVKSIAWYLLAINPFLDYTFTLPGKQSVLMLDWAKDEIVLYPRIEDGVKSGYNPLFPGDAAGTPRPRSSLTDLQQKIVADFLSGPSRAKVVGVHAPPISPYWDWYDADVYQSRKTYADKSKARGPKDGHPMFATTPSQASDTPFGMVADRGSLGRDRERDWFIKLMTDSRYSVRLVLSGHVHRNGLYVVYQSTKPIVVTNPKDSFRNRPVQSPLLVGGLYPQAARGSPPFVTADRRKGPLYITSTSAGPRGSFEKRPLTPRERQVEGTTTDPGYTRMEIANDGTIRSVVFWGGQAPAEKAQIPALQPELGYAMR